VPAAVFTIALHKFAKTQRRRNARSRKIAGMAQQNLGRGWFGLEAGARWRDASGAVTVVIVWIQRSGVIVYRREGGSLDEERVTNVVRFVETFAPANEIEPSLDVATGAHPGH
jgi:hypothetical protein